MGDETVTSWHDGIQTVLNAHCVPARGEQLDFPQPREVAARVHWQTDGWETIDTTAEAWAGDLILVNVADRRSQLRGIWLHAADVTPR